MKLFCLVLSFLILERCKGESRCSRPCEKIYAPVCGTNGVTYSNTCYLSIATCQSNGAIQLKNNYPCWCNRQCHEIYKPVCGTDGITYGNACYLWIATCKSNGKIIKQNDGICDICNLPVVAGPCKATYPRWYYNNDSKTCLGFIYGGCKGNENNFLTKADCQRKCMS